MRKSNIVILGIIVLSFCLSIFFYDKMPDKMATHWGFSGEANGYSGKAFGLFFMPGLLVVLALMFFLIPRIDPLKVNIEKFRNYFDGFIILIFLFMLFLQLFIMFWNIGIKININFSMPIAFAILLFYIGIMLEKVKKNWFIGIRTPWTISNDKVWDKTHKLGSKLFKIAAALSLLGAVFYRYSWAFVLAPIILFSIYLVFYSYFEYKKIK